MSRKFTPMNEMKIITMNEMKVIVAGRNNRIITVLGWTND